MPKIFDTMLCSRGIRVMLMILTVISIVAALAYAKQILAPLAFGLVLGVVVSPVADRLSRQGVPRPATALALLLLTTLLIATIFLLIEPMVNILLDELPRIKATMATLIDRASNLLRGIEEISQEIEESVGADKGGDAEPANKGLPSVGDAIWLAPSFVSQVFIFVGTLFFFTLTRNDLYRLTGRLEAKLRHADKSVSRYFAAITLVNAGLGAATAAALMALGVEYAMLWGLAAGLLNYVLYLGPLMIAVGLAVAGMVQFSGAYAFLPPVIFLLFNLTEANFVTPLVVGKRMAMNPLMIFLSIVFGLWLWGPVGAFVALPLLLWMGVMLEPDPKTIIQLEDSRTA
ncbi:AI-2E family transporter [Cognatishimia maritima]|uniref:Predicted PurR-regulated permease PerM n=1 Tax=Cognatishimia maritima TaxID=870908 RepID=A0A1M5PL72_9RHOB|nr:AI-2E family transporter [Cognatishimia maritima]SHH02471.1 Predicted PurR-regulated permease PerM [Cognatishimia maritima]